jgi:hypothetical protein
MSDVERVPWRDPAIALARRTRQEILAERTVEFDVRAARAILAAMCPPGCGVSARALENEADSALGTEWFNTRFPDCPVMFGSAYTPDLTANSLLHLPPTNVLFRKLGSVVAAGDDRAAAVVFGSAQDGLPLMVAHTAKTTVAPDKWRFEWSLEGRDPARVYMQPLRDLVSWVLSVWTPYN